MFTDEQKELALSAVFRFKKYWETFEEEKLIKDRDAQIAEKTQDAEYFSEERLTMLKDNEEALVEAKMNPQPS